MSIALGNERFPFRYRGKTITISQAELILSWRNASSNEIITRPA